MIKKYSLRFLLYTFFPLSLIPTTTQAQSTVMDIGLFNGLNTTSVMMTPLEGDYKILADDSIIFELKNENLVQLSLAGTNITIKTIGEELGSFGKVSFIAAGKNSSFRLKPVLPDKKVRAYEGNLEVAVVNNALQLVNKVDMDRYIAGVIKSEVGINRTSEFYKVQSIICRTYALSNVRKHEDEGFQLCDKVHCQVYEGKCNDSLIMKAVLSTSGIVLIDASMELITASFHSNCGGQTANSEDVWTLSKPYLRSVTDTFCHNRSHAKWTRNIATAKWVGYLSKKYNYPVDDKAFRKKALNYHPHEREVYFNGRQGMLLKDIRHDWRFMSAYFDISSVPFRSFKGGNDDPAKNGDESGKGENKASNKKNGWLLITGRGYGHGVGLCQEGAMHMAEVGYTYKNILHFYYKGVRLLHIDTLGKMLMER